ncbi:TetR/AcrR family transcriptional regulator [Streptomyces yunnanensis]|uniref:TetR/AcrR family transcriptional regulator n=1 Tax=Streptomyces yunnanensis TaxID=156453 RepID=A0ABY8A782_9ACTN|nr:TetR/AcrR family transcriptional regulator [Streptomyces yunnanensis]WEB39402.1 TetR/AcrR family transcriptional regulator [Streptomyces yunnanensis]
MPKKVDHEARRQEISAALWRLANTRGVDGVSLRDVAAEAGISLGRIQHYFRNKDELLLFALRYINRKATERIGERIRALEEAPTPRTVLRACCAGMLPLDAESRAALLVAAAYYSRAVHDPALGAEARDGIPKLRDFFVDQLRLAAEHGDIPPERATEDEAMLLIALADGLASYVLLGVHGPEQALAVLDRQLDNLFGARGGTGGGAGSGSAVDADGGTGVDGGVGVGRGVGAGRGVGGDAE